MKKMKSPVKASSNKKLKNKTTSGPRTKSIAKANEKEAHGSEEIVELILHDHKPLKDLIEIMKSDKKSLVERKEAYAQFAPLLLAHAKPEEGALYVAMKESDTLAQYAFEGGVEHDVVDQLIEAIKRTDDEIENDGVTGARIKVIADLVEHHLKEEEEEVLPDVKKELGIDERIVLGQRYLQLQKQWTTDMSGGAPEGPQVHPPENRFMHS